MTAIRMRGSTRRDNTSDRDNTGTRRLAKGFSDSTYRKVHGVAFSQGESDGESRVDADRSTCADEEVPADPVAGDGCSFLVGEGARTLVGAEGRRRGRRRACERPGRVLVVLGVPERIHGRRGRKGHGRGRGEGCIHGKVRW